MEVDTSGDDVVAVLPDIDFDFDLDGLDGFDFNLDLAATGFCDGGGGDYFLAAGDEKGKDEPAAGLNLGLGSTESGGGREGWPDSVVTDDGPASGDHDGSMSDYVSELERFLMEDDHDDDGGRTMEELADDDYFFGDLLTGDDGGAAPVEEDSLAAACEDEATSRKRAKYE